MRILLCVLLWIVLQALSYGAPAPLERASRRATYPPERATLVWCEHRWQAWFLPGGRYKATCSSGVWWTGEWELRGNRLLIRERRVEDPLVTDWPVYMEIIRGDQTRSVKLEPPE